MTSEGFKLVLKQFELDVSTNSVCSSFALYILLSYWTLLCEHLKDSFCYFVLFLYSLFTVADVIFNGNLVCARHKFFLRDNEIIIQNTFHCLD